jgi:predicted nucleotidyltransferase
MRLNNQQIEQIKEHILNIYGSKAHAYLFGSRVDDERKGGDIDIFIESDKTNALMDKLKLISLLQMSIGVQKIDVLIKTPTSKHRSIFDTAKKEGIKLC